MKLILILAAILCLICLILQIPGIADEPNNLNRPDDSQTPFCTMLGNCEVINPLTNQQER